MVKIKRKTQKRGRKKNYRKTRKIRKSRKRKSRKRKRKSRKSKRRKRSRKQRGGMATLSEAYGGSNLANVSSNVTNGVEGMENPYGVNDQPSFSSKVSGEIEKQEKANEEQVKANKATKKGQTGGMATLSEAYGSVSSNFEPVTTGVVTGLGSAVLEGNTNKGGVSVPQYKGSPGANKNIVKAAKLGEQQKENRKYDTMQKGGGRRYKKKKSKKKQKGGCGCQERF